MRAYLVITASQQNTLLCPRQEAAMEGSLWYMKWTTKYPKYGHQGWTETNSQFLFKRETAKNYIKVASLTCHLITYYIVHSSKKSNLYNTLTLNIYGKKEIAVFSPIYVIIIDYPHPKC